MEKLDKDYQQVVRTLTKLEEDTGIKKSNFYVLPNSKDQAITFGLLLPNQQKEDGLKADINVNFASFENPEGDFDNYKEFEKAFVDKNKDAKIPGMTLKDIAKHVWSSMQEDDEDDTFSDNDMSDDEVSFDAELPEIFSSDSQELIDKILKFNPILATGTTRDIIGKIVFGHQLGIDDYMVADDEENTFDSLVNDADDDYAGLINILSSYYHNLFTVISDYTVAILSDDIQPKDIKHVTEDVLYALQFYLKLKQKIPELESYVLGDDILSTAEQLVEIMDATDVNQYWQNKVENRGPYYMAMIELVFPLLTGKDKNVQRTIKAIINSHFDAPKCQLTTDGFAKIK